MEALMFIAILVPVAAVMWCLSRPAVDDEEPPTLNVQNDARIRRRLEDLRKGRFG